MAAASASSLKFSLLIRFHSPPTSTTPRSSSISFPLSHLLTPLSLSSKSKKTNPRLLAVAEEKENAVVAEEEKENAVLVEDEKAADGVVDQWKVRVRPCELYVCNLPRSYDIPQLLDLFKSFGMVISVEVSRDAATGISRGCGYITMSSFAEAKAAIAALDGSDLGGREIRVKFSADMVPGRKNQEAFNATPKKDIVFESPFKVYVGNLAWSVRPEDLREHFSQYGTVVSTRVLYDRKGGKNRVYGFLSFSTADELKAALESNGSVFHGRTLLVREGIDREEV